MLGNKPPYTTMQQLNLDWMLSKLKTLLRLVPDDGAVGQILRRTRDGAVWSDEQGGGGGGAVQSVNGKTGAVVLDAADVGALPDDYTPPVTSVNGQTGAVTVSVPVQSVNGKTGAVVLDADDVGALPDDYTPPVTSVNGQTGAVVLDAADVGALPDDYTPPVTSVNGQTGAVVIPTTQMQSTRDWKTAYNNANSFIVVNFSDSYGGDIRQFTIVIPKGQIISTNREFGDVVSFASTSDYSYVRVTCSTTSCTAIRYWYNGANHYTQPDTVTFFYM